jgi:hypothetical protein
MMRRTELLCHTSAWFGLLFATPMLVALGNQQDISIPLLLLLAGLFLLFLLMTLASWGLVKPLNARQRKWIAAVMLAIAFMLAIQGNIVNSLTYFGQFDGSRVDFRKYGSWFWFEWFGFLAGFLLLTVLFGRAKRISAWWAMLPVLSFCLALVPALFSNAGQSVGIASDSYDDSVFEFSTQRNLLHLLPDGLQGDIVEQVFRENPELAARFSGFTLYTDHLGLYYGTAPTLPALLTGVPFDFGRGHTFDWITPHIDENSYQNELADQGYALDLVPIADGYCVSRARSCVSRPFSGWKSWGYDRHRIDSALYSARLMADLTLYRLSPSYLKEKIYAAGEWMLAGSTLGGASPWPDPVIREWTEHMSLVGDAARYKFYHYIGTHKPAFWNAECQRIGALPHTRESFLGQARCLLNSIAELLDKLEAEGIYDQTAMIISGDHGHDIAPADVGSAPESVDLGKEMMGTARPVLLVKELAKREPLKFSPQPSSSVDVAAMALALSESNLADPGREAGAAEEGRFPDRYFHIYPVEKILRWNSEPIPYDRYRVRGPVNRDVSWELLTIEKDHPAPQQFPVVSHRTAADYLHGIRLNPAFPDHETAWIDRRQFAFLISIPGPDATLVLSLHIPDWLGRQEFSVRVNETKLADTFALSAGDKFWQEVRIELPRRALKEGNNFISLEFEELRNAPEVTYLKAAALLNSILVEAGSD